MIGCGAIAERYHLPGLAKIPGTIQNIVLIDRSVERRALMARQFGIHQQAMELSEVIDQIDGAIVAVPPALHHSICMQLLARNVPVLCEKPLAESPTEASELVAVAKQRGVPLGVNHTRRVLPAYAEIKRIVSSGEIGALVEIRWEEGCEFDWPASSAFHFRSGARGVLLDTGVHSLDLICWWLGQKPEVVSCQTDSFGGPEAMAEVRLQSGPCKIFVKHSWLSRLANRYTLVGERGTITGELDHFDRITVSTPDGRRKERRLRGTERTYGDFGARIIANFIDVIAGKVQPLVPAASVLPSLEVMDECYASATRLDMPWLQAEEIASYASA